jgi:outer membrane protein TolC
MKKLIITGYIITSAFVRIWGQPDTISLIQCLKSAQQNAVINAQYQVIEDIAEMKIANTRATNLPSLSAYGKAWYQSDAITVVNPTGPGLEIDRFQYNTGVEADQKLYGGSLAKRSRDLELSNRESEYYRIETDKYQLNTQVSDLFFKTLLLQKNKEILQLKDQVLEERVREMESAYQNGIIRKNDLDKLKAEVLLLRQQEIELEKLFQQNIATLTILTGIVSSGDPALIVEESILQIEETLRPEYAYFEAESKKMENLARVKKANILPKLYAYGQVGYSYPGLNFFENEADYYYIVGAKLAWTIFDWNQSGREAEIMRKQKELVESRKDDFNQKLSISLDRESIEQEKLREIIAMDKTIIGQRELITRGSENSLANGVITSTDYLEDLNAEIKARVDCETHKLQLQNSKVRQKLLKGIEL